MMVRTRPGSGRGPASRPSAHPPGARTLGAPARSRPPLARRSLRRRPGARASATGGHSGVKRSSAWDRRRAKPEQRGYVAGGRVHHANSRNVSRMYPGIYTPKLLVEQNNDDHRPIFFVEYSHAMGISNGNMKEFWDEFRSTPRVIGGAIWEYTAQGLLKTDSAGVAYYAYGGDFGERYFDNFTIKGIATSDGRPKAAMYECKRVFTRVPKQN